MTVGGRARTPWLAFALAAITCAPPLVASAQTSSSAFEGCAPADGSWTYDDLLCVYLVGARERRLDEARERLRALGAGEATGPWATLVLGHATLTDDEAAAIRHYETAAAAFATMADAEGEVIARQNLRILFRRRGDPKAAARQVALAVAAAAASNQPLIVARASVLEASHLIETGEDLGRAQQILTNAEGLAFPNGSIGLRRSILFQLATANLYLGLFDEAIVVLERHRALRAEDGSTADAAAVAFNLLNAHVARAEARPVHGARARLVAMAEAVVKETQALDRPYVEAQAHRVLGDLLRPAEPDRARRHLMRCLEIERPLGYPAIRAACLWALSLQEVRRDPTRADQLSREAMALAAADSSGLLLAFAWQARLRLVWDALDEPEAITESLAAIDAIERLRAAQPDEGSRIALFGHWTRDYYWLAGRLLDLDEPRLGQAFAVGERLRARVLLDRLARAGVSDAGAGRAASGGALSRRMADVQRQLPTATGRERQVLSDRLALMALERREQGAGRVPVADSSEMTFASLDDVRAALQRDEALLWYSVAPWADLYGAFGGGAWLLAITRDGVVPRRLDLPVDLDSQVSAFAGLLRQRSVARDVWMPAARRLGAMLLGRALDALPPRVSRVTIVADGVLHELPFDVVVPMSDGKSVAERFEVTVVPSATLWLRLRRRAGAAGATAVVLADPELRTSTVLSRQSSVFSPQSSGLDGLRIDPLPGARREARAVVAALGLDAGVVREGAAASEHALKTMALDEASLVHLAAHARADARFPDRSAVFLTPGADDEDGWLRPSEIARLGLRGGLVVLSACESAGGPNVAGEGLLSLARAFFAGGAGTVIATRWPLRDDDAAFLMTRFYAALASGATVGASMRQARLDAIRAGLPVEAWAGFALLGDGAGGPRLPQPPAGPDRWWWGIPAATVIAAAVLAAVRRAWRSSPAA